MGKRILPQSIGANVGFEEYPDHQVKLVEITSSPRSLTAAKTNQLSLQGTAMELDILLDHPKKDVEERVNKVYTQSIKGVKPNGEGEQLKRKSQPKSLYGKGVEEVE